MRVRRWGAGLAAAAGSLLLTSCHLPTFGDPGGASTSQGKSILHLWQGFFIAAMAVGAIVWALIFYVVIRYRKRGDEVPSQRQYNIPIEVIYTAIPVVIVAVLFGFTVHTQRRVDRVSATPAVSIKVTAYQWGWRFDYTGRGLTVSTQNQQAPTLVLPAGQTVGITLVSADVVHSFWVPDFLFKRDAVPGFTNHFDLDIQRAGTYGGRCSAFCGLRHDEMRFTVEALSPADFQQWLASQSAGRAS
jgi:cytochrome c oxidase subunit 2